MTLTLLVTGTALIIIAASSFAVRFLTELWILGLSLIALALICWLWIHISYSLTRKTRVVAQQHQHQYHQKLPKIYIKRT